jgi:tagatose 6-phosphate kinase
VILTVTLNLALDVTYELPGVAWGEANRVARVRARRNSDAMCTCRTAGVPRGAGDTGAAPAPAAGLEAAAGAR